MATVFCQERQAYGRVINAENKKPVQGVVVEVLRDQHQTYTNDSGKYQIEMPKGAFKLSFAHKDYEQKIVMLKNNFWTHSNEVEMNLIKLQDNSELSDSEWKSKKNAAYWLPLELFNGSIGVQYERFIKEKNSLGLQFSCYLAGWGYPTGGNDVTSHYFGYKIGFFYRHFFGTNERKRFFVGGKLLLGHFDFDPLIYKHAEYYWFERIATYTTKAKVDFWSYGVGIEVGWYFKMPHSIFTLSFGPKYFPMRAPGGINVLDSYHNNQAAHPENVFWYLTGPGSVLEVKIGIGGVF